MVPLGLTPSLPPPTPHPYPPCPLLALQLKKLLDEEFRSMADFRRRAGEFKPHPVPPTLTGKVRIRGRAALGWCAAVRVPCPAVAVVWLPVLRLALGSTHPLPPRPPPPSLQADTKDSKRPPAKAGNPKAAAAVPVGNGVIKGSKPQQQHQQQQEAAAAADEGRRQLNGSVEAGPQ